MTTADLLMLSFRPKTFPDWCIEYKMCCKLLTYLLLSTTHRSSTYMKGAGGGGGERVSRGLVQTGRDAVA